MELSSGRLLTVRCLDQALERAFERISELLGARSAGNTEVTSVLSAAEGAQLVECGVRKEHHRLVGFSAAAQVTFTHETHRALDREGVMQLCRQGTPSHGYPHGARRRESADAMVPISEEVVAPVPLDGCVQKRPRCFLLPFC